MNKLNIMVTLVVTTAIFCIIFVLYSISYSSLHRQRSYNSVVQSLQELIIKKENETLKFAILHATDPNWMFLYKALLTEGEKIDNTLRLKV